MKQKMKTLLAYSLLAGLIFTSCKKDDPEPQEKLLYPVKITEYENGVYDSETTFEYNADKKIVKEVYDSEYYDTYAYNTEGKLIEKKKYYKNKIDKLDSMEYNTNGQLVKIQRYSPTGEKRGWYTLEYDTQGKVTKKTEYLSDETVYAYNIYVHDANGNTINQKFYRKDYVTGTILTNTYDETTLQYDDKNNIYKAWGLPFIWETYINNITQKVFTQTPDRNDNYTVTYTYIYNDDNYPIEYTEGNEKYVIEYKEL